MTRPALVGSTDMDIDAALTATVAEVRRQEVVDA